MPKWLPPVLILFLAFYILSKPTEAGPQTREFLGWVGTQASSALTFIDELVGDEASGPDSSPTSSDDTNSSANSDGTGDQTQTEGQVTETTNQLTFDQEG